jgi:protein gp37
MGKNSKIQWTDHTFNPWVGCQKVSAGCAHCYAEREMTRKTRWANAWGPPASSERLRTTEAYWRKPFRWQLEAKENGTAPKVFCGSLCDVFEDNRQVEHWRIELFEHVICETPHLTWLVLTKRPERALEFFNNRPELLTGNIWMGTSAEDQETYDERKGDLCAIEAEKIFLSLEPLILPVNLDLDYYPVDWVIVGGESGPDYRLTDMKWVRSIRDQCQDAGVPFFFKQVSGTRPNDSYIPKDLRIREFPSRLK